MPLDGAETPGIDQPEVERPGSPHGDAADGHALAVGAEQPDGAPGSPPAARRAPAAVGPVVVVARGAALDEHHEGRTPPEPVRALTKPRVTYPDGDPPAPCRRSSAAAAADGPFGASTICPSCRPTSWLFTVKPVTRRRCCAG